MPLLALKLCTGLRTFLWVLAFCYIKGVCVCVHSSSLSPCHVTVNESFELEVSAVI